jgi:microcompartment protein CcmL/EutN
MIFGPAVSTFEISSIARGYFLLDRLVKKAPVKILEASSVSPGKFFILINGDEASVDESRKELLSLAANQIIDEVYIPQLHPEVLPALYSQNNFRVNESLGIIETATVGSGLLSADFCAKSADVKIIDIRMARGIGGKAYYFFTGKLEDVQAGIDAGTNVIAPKGMLIRSEIIASPHEDFLKYFNVGDSP